MIFAEAVTFDPRDVILALVALAVLAVAALAWTIFTIRFGYYFGRTIRDRRLMGWWALFSLPFVLVFVDRIKSGDMRDFGWYLALLAFVVVPPLVGWAVQRFRPESPPDVSEARPGTQPKIDDT